MSEVRDISGTKAKASTPFEKILTGQDGESHPSVSWLDSSV